MLTSPRRLQVIEVSVDQLMNSKVWGGWVLQRAETQELDIGLSWGKGNASGGFLL